MSGSGDGPQRIRVATTSEIGPAMDACSLPRGRPVLVLVGGAGGMGEAEAVALTELFRTVVLPVVDQCDGVVVDGGTDAGVMRIVGRLRTGCGGFPLVGVAAVGTVDLDAGAVDADAAVPEPHHTHLVLVPGTAWGDESPWLSEVAHALASDAPSLTLVVNGGRITYDDIAASLVRGRPVLVLAGSGRTADEIAAARAGIDTGPRAAAIAASPLTRVVDREHRDEVRRHLLAALRPSEPGGRNAR